MSRIAFFDFDGTLTEKDTFKEFALFSVGSFRFYKSLVFTAHHIIAWKLGVKSNSYAKEKLFRNLYKGMTLHSFNEKCQKFSQHIDSILKNDTIAKLQFHQQQGDITVIVSASIENWIKPWAQVNGIDEVLATQIEVDANGVLTGNFSSRNCHGKEKAKRILAHYPEVTKMESYAYGDSSGDNEMFDLVDFPTRIE